jgi:vesicle-fusing ATPase
VQVRPAFGVTEDKLEKAIMNGIIPYSQDFVNVLNAGKLLIKQVEGSAKTPLLSLILHGTPFFT